METIMQKESSYLLVYFFEEDLMHIRGNGNSFTK